MRPTSLQENGPTLALIRLLTVPPRRLRDHLLARQLNAPGLRLGRSPRLLGLRHMRLGRNLHTGDSLWLEAVTDYAGQPLEPLLTIGDDCNLSDRVHIACAHQIAIGSSLLCGSGVLISDHAHGRYTGPDQSPPDVRPALRPLSTGRPILIGSNVWIGDHVSILPGATIGDGAILGANSVVTGTIPPATIAVGAPAKPIRRWSPATRAWEPL